MNIRETNSQEIFLSKRDVNLAIAEFIENHKCGTKLKRSIMPDDIEYICSTITTGGQMTLTSVEVKISTVIPII